MLTYVTASVTGQWIEAVSQMVVAGLLLALALRTIHRAVPRLKTATRRALGFLRSRQSDFCRPLSDFCRALSDFFKALSDFFRALSDFL